jgi:hypothetical protein
MVERIFPCGKKMFKHKDRKEITQSTQSNGRKNLPLWQKVRIVLS